MHRWPQSKVFPHVHTTTENFPGECSRFVRSPIFQWVQKSFLKGDESVLLPGFLFSNVRVANVIKTFAV